MQDLNRPLRKRDLHSLPNLFTAANLFCGVMAIYSLLTLWDNWLHWFILGSLICDFFDGAVARKMQIQSAIGKELDSLADVISFGVVPACMLMRMFNPDLQLDFSFSGLLLFILPISVAIYSAFRLAKFNLETRDSEYFYGLNTPSNTLMILGVYLAWMRGRFGLPDFLDHNIPVLIASVVLINYLMISNTPMFSNKSIKKQFKGNLPFIIIGIIGLVSFFFFGYLGISITILSYVLLSLVSLRFKLIHF